MRRSVLQSLLLVAVLWLCCDLMLTGCYLVTAVLCCQAELLAANQAQSKLVWDNKFSSGYSCSSIWFDEPPLG